MSDNTQSHGSVEKRPAAAKPAFGSVIETGIIKFGNIISVLILIITFFTTYEVFARYFFNSPTSWAWPINRQLFAIFALAGGAYTMAHGMHIRIEMLQERFGPGMKLTVRFLSLLCLFIFLGVLIWQGISFGWTALTDLEVLPGVFKLPVYPVKMFLPLAALLFLIEGVVCFYQKKL